MFIFVQNIRNSNIFLIKDLQNDRTHNDGRPFPCTECGKRFRQQSHLIQHLRIHANEKPFSCPYCPHSFRQRANLNQHIRIHSGEKPYACPECGKHFRQKAILNQHVRTHQGERHLLNLKKKKSKIRKLSKKYSQFLYFVWKKKNSMILKLHTLNLPGEHVFH